MKVTCERLIKRILIVSPNHNVLAPSSGTGSRLQNVAKRLGEDNEVSVILPREFTTKTPEWVKAVYGFKQFSAHYLGDLNPFFIRRMITALRNEDPDIIHFALPKGVCITRMILSRIDVDAELVYAAQDVEAEHARNFVDDSLPIYKRLFGPRLIPQIERLTVRCADYVTTVSDRDRRKFVKRYGLVESQVQAVPTGAPKVDRNTLLPEAVVRERYDIGTDPVAVFHGSYNHPPNREAVELLCEKIAPALRQRDVDIQILLIGKGMPECNASNLHSLGFVDDLFSILNIADLAIVPILHGGGMKTKVLDYMSLGIPIVSTEKGVEGIELQNGKHGIITENVDDQFIEGIVEFLSHPEQRRAVGENVYQLAVKQYDWDAIIRDLEAFYDRISSQSPAATATK